MTRASPVNRKQPDRVRKNEQKSEVELGQSWTEIETGSWVIAGQKSNRKLGQVCTLAQQCETGSNPKVQRLNLDKNHTGSCVGLGQVRVGQITPEVGSGQVRLKILAQQCDTGNDPKGQRSNMDKNHTGSWVGLGQVRLGSVGLGSVGLGQVRLGSVGFGSVGLGQVGLGWVRLGYKHSHYSAKPEVMSYRNRKGPQRSKVKSGQTGILLLTLFNQYVSIEGRII